MSPATVIIFARTLPITLFLYTKVTSTTRHQVALSRQGFGAGEWHLVKPLS